MVGHQGKEAMKKVSGSLGPPDQSDFTSLTKYGAIATAGAMSLIPGREFKSQSFELPSWRRDALGSGMSLPMGRITQYYHFRVSMVW